MPGGGTAQGDGGRASCWPAAPDTPSAAFFPVAEATTRKQRARGAGRGCAAVRLCVHASRHAAGGAALTVTAGDAFTWCMARIVLPACAACAGDGEVAYLGGPSPLREHALWAKTRKTSTSTNISTGALCTLSTHTPLRAAQPPFFPFSSKKRRRSRDSDTDSDSRSGDSSDSRSASIERKKEKAERLVRAHCSRSPCPAAPDVVVFCPQARKLSQRAAKAGGSIAGYTNDSNPFGDPNLTQRHVSLGRRLLSPQQKCSRLLGPRAAQFRVAQEA